MKQVPHFSYGVLAHKHVFNGRGQRDRRVTADDPALRRAQQSCGRRDIDRSRDIKHPDTVNSLMRSDVLKDKCTLRPGRTWTGLTQGALSATAKIGQMNLQPVRHSGAVVRHDDLHLHSLCIDFSDFVSHVEVRLWSDADGLRCCVL